MWVETVNDCGLLKKGDELEFSSNKIMVKGVNGAMDWEWGTIQASGTKAEDKMGRKGDFSLETAASEWIESTGDETGAYWTASDTPPSPSPAT